VFCAGYDLNALPSAPDPAWLRGHGELEATLRLLREGPLPTVAALTGAAVGAGLELALSCDLRVAHREVIVQMPPVKLGIVYTLEGIWRLATLCGAARARELLLLAEPIPAEAAARHGLISRVVAADAVLPTACALAQKMAAQPRSAVLGTRRLLEHLLRSGPSLSEDQAQELLALRLDSWQSAEAHLARETMRARRQRDST
jgi:enoyl-CoA hydratase/carnithine racemase